MPLAGIGIGLGTAIAGAASGGAAIAGGILSSNANNNASNAQAEATKYAAKLQDEAAKRAEDAAREQQGYDRWLTSATAEARKPYLDAISSALGTAPQGGFSPSGWSPTPFEAAKPFTAPTQAEAEADPGYQFSLKEGQKALERSAAARGTILTGGTLKDITAYGQERGSEQYDKVLGRDLSLYNTNEANRFNAWNANTNAGYQAASLNQQGQYQAASLAMDEYSRKLTSLFSLAGLASPGAYPGYTDTRQPSAGPAAGPVPYTWPYQNSGSGGTGDPSLYAAPENGITPEKWNMTDPLNPVPTGMYGSLYA